MYTYACIIRHTFIPSSSSPPPLYKKGYIHKWSRIFASDFIILWTLINFILSLGQTQQKRKKKRQWLFSNNILAIIIFTKRNDYALNIIRLNSFSLLSCFFFSCSNVQFRFIFPSFIFIPKIFHSGIFSLSLSLESFWNCIDNAWAMLVLASVSQQKYHSIHHIKPYILRKVVFRYAHVD